MNQHNLLPGEKLILASVHRYSSQHGVHTHNTDPRAHGNLRPRQPAVLNGLFLQSLRSFWEDRTAGPGHHLADKAVYESAENHQQKHTLGAIVTDGEFGVVPSCLFRGFNSCLGRAQYT
jgi:hypothetical protein